MQTNNYLFQAERAWEGAEELFGRSEESPEPRTRTISLLESKDQERIARTLALLSIATDLNRIANHLDALASTGVDVDGATLEALRTLPLR